MKFKVGDKVICDDYHNKNVEGIIKRIHATDAAPYQCEGKFTSELGTPTSLRGFYEFELTLKPTDPNPNPFEAWCHECGMCQPLVKEIDRRFTIWKCKECGTYIIRRRRP